MITIIIPALNEEEHIASVVSYAWSHPNVNEVIVVDDNSIDRTAAIALENGAKVITSKKTGKGTSMKEGIESTCNEIICFLDGDIDPYPPDTIQLLTEPIISGKADFVKSTFCRNAGRVTELVAKPLLSILFPSLLTFSQPLSGMIAGRKSILQWVDFFDDYGVDIGILIDMHLMKARCMQVEIGYLENKSKPWQALGNMSREVAHAIIRKAGATQSAMLNLYPDLFLREIQPQLELNPEFSSDSEKKLILFDMDNTLLEGRYIDFCASAFGFSDELAHLRSFEQDSVILTKRIANFLIGKPIHDLLSLADQMPIVKGTKDIISELKERGYLVGIISDSYDCVAKLIKNKLSMDFALSNELEFSNSICTGEVKIPSFFFKDVASWCKHNICKSHAFQKVLQRFDIKNENTIVVGDSHNDLCMIKNAGRGVAFNSTDQLVNTHADMVIKSPSFIELLSLTR